MAASSNIRIVVNSIIDGSNGSESIDSIVQKINTARQSVELLREENLRYERIRDQYIIHLQQCQEDHNRLRQIYKKLRLKFDLCTKNFPNNLEQNTAQNTTQALLTNVQVTSQTPKLINIQLTPQITSLSESFPPTNVTLRHAISTSSVICTVQFSSDGSKVAFADGFSIYIINPETGESISTIPLPTSQDSHNQYTRALQFSPDDKLLALSGPNNTLLLYNINSKSLIHTFEGHTKEINSVVFSADGKWVISGGYDGVINVWDTSNFSQVKRLVHGNGQNDGIIVRIATTPEVPFYAVGFHNGKIGIYSDTFDQPMTSFPGHQQQLLCIAVSPFDDTIATVAQDNALKVWMVRGVATLRHTLEGHTDFPLVVAFSPKEPLMFTGSKDKTIRIWNHKTGEALCVINAHQDTVFQISHHPTQKAFVSCSGDGFVCIWDYQSQK
ncbi:Transcriptional repressor tup12-related protein [Histomonas meleagridis]|uniref:Transcriptional repressor tup12-related protein n=1 Tax=Histomonas meleagridis TaxID=135588 RepID=UPI003559F29B|nr:Transcriptional repressor tup12-related protein [Histomonas meleagridis]KAH0803267.1 Transcriptional repressor tup12-related protein [Histomonas meleagridis]